MAGLRVVSGVDSRIFWGAERGNGALCKGWEGVSLRIRCKYVFDSFHSLGEPFCLWIFILSLIFGNNPWHRGVKGCWDGYGAQKQQGVLGDGMDRNGVSSDPDQGQHQQKPLSCGFARARVCV